MRGCEQPLRQFAGGRRGRTGRDWPRPCGHVNVDDHPEPRPHGGALYCKHDGDPSIPDPIYWVSPRHLAGDGQSLADRVGAALSSAGWRMWPTARDTLLYTSPNGAVRRRVDTRRLFLRTGRPSGCLAGIGPAPSRQRPGGVERALHRRRPPRGADRLASRPRRPHGTRLLVRRP